jgi:hypothetical protein
MSDPDEYADQGQQDNDTYSDDTGDSSWDRETMPEVDDDE